MRDGGPFRISSTPTGKPCPRCAGDGLQLMAMPIGQVPTERCTGCRGVWLTAATFNELRMNPDWQREILGGAELPRAANDDGPGIVCPDCRRDMQRANLGRVSGIVVDTCRRHGIWFDVGELRGAVDFMANHNKPGLAPDTPETRAPRPVMPFHVAVVDFFLELLSWSLGTPR